MASVNDSETLLLELNKNTVNELIPLFVILSVLLILGLVGNAALIWYVWSEAKKNVGTFFLLVLAGVDMLISLTVTLVLYEYSKIYILQNEAVCKISAFLRFAASLFSAFVLVAIACHRYQMVCRPLKKQLDITAAKTLTMVAVIMTVLLSVPQMILVETADIEVSIEENVTRTGSDCVMRVLSDSNVKGFHTLIEATYAVLFIGSFVVLFILYILLGKAIMEANERHDRITQTTYLASINRHQGENKDNDQVEDSAVKDADGPNGDNGKTILVETSPSRAPTKKPNNIMYAIKTSSTRINVSAKVDRQRSVDYISSTKLTVMFFTITLGFIFSFVPYIIYSTWRNFFAETTEVAFSISPLNLFCLNSYLFNSVVNFIVYGFFNKRFRIYLKNCVSCRKIKQKSMN